MTIKKEVSGYYELHDMLWSTARNTLDIIEEKDMLNEFENLINELYPEGVDLTELNDLLRFDDEWVFEALGITEYIEEDEE